MGIGLSLLVVVLILLVAGNLFTGVLQDWFIFRPERLPADHAYSFCHPFEEIFLETPHQGRINALWFRKPESRGVVLYFHGNADSLRRWGHLYYVFFQRGYDFFVIDYRGFGKSSGSRTEANLYADAQAAYAFVRQHYAAENIVLYGRSLGSAFASRLAARQPVGRLVLETPFSTMGDLYHAYFPFLPRLFRFKYLLSNMDHLREVSCPVMVFHGTRDLVVPYKVAARIREALKPGDVFVTIDGGSHNNLLYFDLYNEELNRFLA